MMRMTRAGRRRLVRLCAVAAVVASVLTLIVAAAPEAAAANVGATLVRTVLLSTLNPPAPDPSGIAWDAVGNRLIIADSEVEEMSIYQGVNMFELDLQGNLTVTGDVTPPAGFSNEPTGLSFDPLSGDLFISDDQTRRAYVLAPGFDGTFGTGDDSLISSFKTSDFGNSDPEDIAFDPSTGDLFTVDGTGREVYRISPGTNGRFDGVPPAGDDVTSHFDVGVYGATGSEGLAYDPVRDTLLVLDPGTKTIYETSKAGALLNKISLSAVNPRHAEDVVLAPSLADPSKTNLYIVARGVDNDSDPNENDGKMYEASVSLPPVPNQPPVVSAGYDATVTMPDPLTLAGSVSDDGLPQGTTVTSEWAEVSGPGTAVFADATSPTTQVSFDAAGTYVLRLSASDSQLGASDDVTVLVRAEGTVTLEVPVATSFDDVEENASGGINRRSAALDLAYASGGSQSVGLRFLNVAVPQGATIANAYVQFRSRATSSTAVTLTISGHDVDSAPAFTTAAFNVSSRARTNALVTWQPPAWTVAQQVGPDQRTPDLSDVLQEIVDRSGWNQASMVLIISGNGGTAKRVADSFNGGFAPVLHIQYAA